MNTFFKKSLVLALFLAVGLTAGLAQAKTLDAGTAYLEPKFGVYSNANPRIGSMLTYGGELGYFVVPDVSVGGEVLGYSINQRKNPNSLSNTWENVGAFGVNGILRYHFVDGQTYSFFGGLGLGAMFAESKVPRNGYDSSFSQLAEVGANVFVVDSVSLQLAGRWQHFGEYSNKGSDNWGGNVAVKFIF